MKSGTLSGFFRRLLKKFVNTDTSPSRFKSNLPESNYSNSFWETVPLKI